MSYTIVYDRQVIKTEHGYILSVLSGDNNVWEPARNKRAKSWSCWSFDQTADEIETYFKGFCGNEYEEHFQTGNKFLDDKGLMNWAKNSIKNAKTVEEIQLLEPYISVRCFCYVRAENQNNIFPKRELDKYIHSTSELNSWVEDVNRRKKTCLQNESIYPVVEFGRDKALHLNGKTIPEGKVVVKVGKGMFVTQVDGTGRWQAASSNMKDVLVFGNIYEAFKQTKCSGPHIEFIDYEDFLSKNSIKKEKNFVIEVNSKAGRPMGYYYRGTRSGFQYTYTKEKAKRFDKSGAEAALRRLGNRDFEDAVFKLAQMN